MQNVFILLLLLAAPASLGVIGWGLILIWQTAGLVAFFLSCAAIAAAGLGVASLLDKNQPL